jgi:hypothetical protein
MAVFEGEEEKCCSQEKVLSKGGFSWDVAFGVTFNCINGLDECFFDISVFKLHFP